MERAGHRQHEQHPQPVSSHALPLSSSGGWGPPPEAAGPPASQNARGHAAARRLSDVVEPVERDDAGDAALAADQLPREAADDPPRLLDSSSIWAAQALGMDRLIRLAEQLDVHGPGSDPATVDVVEGLAVLLLELLVALGGFHRLPSRGSSCSSGGRRCRSPRRSSGSPSRGPTDKVQATGRDGAPCSASRPRCRARPSHTCGSRC